MTLTTLTRSRSEARNCAILAHLGIRSVPFGTPNLSSAGESTFRPGGYVGGHYAERFLRRAHVDGLPVAVDQHGRFGQNMLLIKSISRSTTPIPHSAAGRSGRCCPSDFWV